MCKQAFFIASTGQHVGKTTTALGLLAGLNTRFPKVGFMKPVGQESTKTPSGTQVDKDVLLVKNHFDLLDEAPLMSPVLFPRGFTRRYLDGQIDSDQLADQIQSAFKTIQKRYNFVVVEGTGHVGVGSIVNLSNAKVASLLKIPIILIASGGLGSSFDALCLNKVLCDQASVRVAGIILNRVLKEKREMVLSYMKKAIKKWDIPILGCIPFDPVLANPSMNDFEILFQAPLLAGEDYHFRHFRQLRLAASSFETFRQTLGQNELVITPANREDIILGLLEKHWEVKQLDQTSDLEAGIILTGSEPPPKSDPRRSEKSGHSHTLCLF